MSAIYIVYIIDYILGVIMWTLIGRVSNEYLSKRRFTIFFMKVFVNLTNPLIRLFKPITPRIYYKTFGATICCMVLLYD